MRICTGTTSKDKWIERRESPVRRIVWKTGKRTKAPSSPRPYQETEVTQAFKVARVPALARRVVLHLSTYQVKIPGIRNPVVHLAVAWCPCRTKESCLTAIKEVSICDPGLLQIGRGSFCYVGYLEHIFGNGCWEDRVAEMIVALPHTGIPDRGCQQRATAGAPEEWRFSAHDHPFSPLMITNSLSAALLAEPWAA